MLKMLINFIMQTARDVLTASTVLNVKTVKIVLNVKNVKNAIIAITVKNVKNVIFALVVVIVYNVVMRLRKKEMKMSNLIHMIKNYHSNNNYQTFFQKQEINKKLKESVVKIVNIATDA